MTGAITGAEMIKWIQDNQAENLKIYACDDGCGLYPVCAIDIVTNDHHKYPKEETYVVLDECVCK